MVESPCVDRCKIIQRTGVCRGCGRTLAELKAWKEASDAEKSAILDLLPARAPLMVESEQEQFVL
ncbi:MAG TPA: DUF1289 domain-containing protein [Patescibacteria group bacterium]|nr:DUF1289 domain-containing protein [Patescibacteria group bacterium]